MVKGGTTYWILCDQVGSMRLVVNATTGAVAQRIDYDAFGVATQDTNPGFQPFGFAGGLTDQDTGKGALTMSRTVEGRRFPELSEPASESTARM